jgi:Tfp pilus assembly protein PilF
MIRHHPSTFKTFQLFLLALVVSFNAHTNEAVAIDRFQADLPHSLVSKVDDARYLRLKGDSATALQELEAVIQVRPDYYRAQYNLGLAAAALNRSDIAETAFKNAETLLNDKNINDATFYNSYGWFALTKNRLDEADRLFREAANYESKMTDITRQRLYNNVGILALKKDDIERALACFQMAAKLGSKLATKQLDTLLPKSADNGNTEKLTTELPDQWTINTTRSCFIAEPSKAE